MHDKGDTLERIQEAIEEGAAKATLEAQGQEASASQLRRAMRDSTRKRLGAFTVSDLADQTDIANQPAPAPQQQVITAHQLNEHLKAQGHKRRARRAIIAATRREMRKGA